MTLRYWRRTALACILTLSLLSGIACDANKLAKDADTGAKALQKARPIVVSLIDGGAIPRDKGEAILARLDHGATIFTNLATAFRNADNGSILSLTDQAIDVLDHLIQTDVLLIKDQAKRTLILSILAAADLALGIIADNLVQGASGISRGASVSGDRIQEFAKKARLKCRDSITGQFQKMEVCRLNPATTTVER